MVAANQAIRNGDYRHRQIISNQLRHSTHNPVKSAQALARMIRDRIGTGQPLGSGYFRNLPDDTWSELVALLSPEELDAVHRVCDVDVYNPANTISDDEPIPFEVTQTSHTPSWRDHEPPIVHSLKWNDADGIEHLHVVRADDLDEALRHILKVKVCIKAAQLKAQKACDPAPTPTPDSRPDWCHVHNVAMKQRGDEGKGYWHSHKAADGSWCRGKAKA